MTDESQVDWADTAQNKAAVTDLLEQRWQAYLADPSTATTWEKVQERMHAYRAQRRAEQGQKPN